MAISGKDSSKPLVTLDILDYYDDQIKKWVLSRIDEGSDTSIVFLEKNKFPSIGNIDTLYVAKDGLYLWDQGSNKYIAISSNNETSSGSVKWGSF